MPGGGPVPGADMPGGGPVEKVRPQIYRTKKEETPTHARRRAWKAAKLRRPAIEMRGCEENVSC